MFEGRDLAFEAECRRELENDDLEDWLLAQGLKPPKLDSTAIRSRRRSAPRPSARDLA
jgi:hypothetical protein